jgi:DNA-directed RNA polymerase specialized sigma24 family protein
MIDEPEDQRLIQLLEKVDKWWLESFEQMRLSVRRLLTAKVCGNLNNRKSAEGICYKVLAKPCEQARKTRHPLTWLHNFVKERAIDRLRSKQQRANLNQRFRGQIDTPANRLSRNSSDIDNTSEHAAKTKMLLLERLPGNNMCWNLPTSVAIPSLRLRADLACLLV